MGHRNEPARERRRRYMKQQMSLTSLPLDDRKGRLLTLKNHFGWMALQKCQVGDGNISLRYPQVVQYHENPEMNGPNYKKVTYVMYLDGKEGDVGKKEKEIQTGPPTGGKEVIFIQPPRDAYKPHEPVEPRKIQKVEDEPDEEKKERFVVREYKPVEDKEERVLVREYKPVENKEKRVVVRKYTPVEDKEKRVVVREYKPVEDNKERVLVSEYKPVEDMEKRFPLKEYTWVEDKEKRVVVREYKPVEDKEERVLAREYKQVEDKEKQVVVREYKPVEDKEERVVVRLYKQVEEKEKRVVVREDKPPRESSPQRKSKLIYDIYPKHSKRYSSHQKKMINYLGSAPSRTYAVLRAGAENAESDIFLSHRIGEGIDDEDKLVKELKLEPDSAVNHCNYECEGRDAQDKLGQELKLKQDTAVKYFNYDYDKRFSIGVMAKGQMLWVPALRTNAYLYINKNKAGRTMRDRSWEG